MDIAMSKKHLVRHALLKGCAEGRYSNGELTKRLGLCARQIRRLKAKFRETGEAAVIHGNRGRKPAHAISEELRKRIVAIKSEDVYCDMNFSHFREFLESDFGIKISQSALRRVLAESGIVSKKCHRRKRKIRRYRERRGCFGELLQADASSYKWFGPEGGMFALHGFIDDATGRITALYMSRNECLLGYLEALRATITLHGLPMELYTDRSGIFNVNEKNASGKSMESKDSHGSDMRKTQFGKMLDELGINPIFANSPQAKGRVERMWGTLQDRLTIFFRKNKVATIGRANKILPKFIKEHNARFSVEPADGNSCFVQVLEETDLDKLLAVKYERITDKCGAFSFRNIKFQVEASESMAGKKITFLFSDKIGIMAKCGKKYYPVKQLSFMGSRANPVPDTVKDLFRKCYLENAHSPNYSEPA
jgi:transposase